jgi:hypothetical protein
MHPLISFAEPLKPLLTAGETIELLACILVPHS